MLLAAPAGASELLDGPVTVDRPLERNCIVGAPAGPGIAERTVTAPVAGWITARLDAASGDWDLAVFDAANGQRIAGGTSFGSHELAQGFVAEGQRLRVQACRRSGTAARAQLSVGSTAVPAGPPVRPSLVIVSTPNRDRKNELLELGLDVTEHGGKGFLGVVLYGAEDARRLREAKFVYRTVIEDLVQAGARQRAADRRFRSSVQASTLPSGRDTYRRLDDYTSEMKQLAADNPGLVKPLTLPFKTYSGRSVEGIEITENVDARDGKPVFLNMGIHHAREWPSGEHAMEWAYELVKGYRAGNERVRRLMGTTRTIVIPVVNPDGFNTSREAGEAAGRGGGGENPSGDDTAALATPYEYQRKNCRVVDPNGPDPETGDCTQQPATGLEQFGVDPNRNYGGLWGGPGNSGPGGTPPGEYEQDYRGEAPFSEPETRNIQRLVSTRQVTTLITNHTASNLLLRPPGIQSLGETPDESAGYKALGDAMAAENGYTSQFGYELYDTTGTTEDWTYFATGGFGFTFEIGCEEKNEETQACDAFYFHPDFAKVVAEYEGTSEEADEDGRDGLGNREAYFIAQESTADATRHSVIAGSVPAPAVLRLSKSFKTRTSPVILDGVEGDLLEFDDKLETILDAPGGTFAWHVNPSTRPVVARDSGRAPQGEPSAPLSFSGGIAGTGQAGDDGSAVPAGDAESDDPANFNDHVIVVPAQGNGVDNAKMTVKIEWPAPASDWDVRLYRDENADGQPEGDPLSVSQQGPSNFEQVTISESVTGGTAGFRPGQYVLRVNNFAAGPEGNYDGTVTFQGPDPLVKAQVESWKLTCEFPEGNVLTSVNVTVFRGDRNEVDLSACTSSIREVCVNGRSGAKGRRLGPAYLGRSRGKQRAALKDKRRSGRRGIDTYCVTGGGKFRIGYPTGRLNRRIGRGLRLRVRRKAILVLTSSERFGIRGVRVGDSAARVRARLRRERRLRVGRNTWFVARAGRASLVFKVRGGSVQEVGIADKRLTRSRRATRRLLRAWKL